MKKVIFYSLLAVVLLIGGWLSIVFYGQYENHRERAAFKANATDTAAPNVEVWRDSILIPYQQDKRTVHVYLPPDYELDSLKSYPVIYFMDGAGAFSDLENGQPEWQVDEVLNAAHQNGKQTAIVFAIESADDRDNEYKPWAKDDYPQAHGAQFGAWLAGEFKPWVDSNYRTLAAPAHTTISGISLSGMMAYYLTMEHPAAFGNAIIQSPSMWVDEEKLLAMSLPAEVLQEKKLFISVGGEEGSTMTANARNLYEKFVDAGLPADQLRFKTVEGEGHSHLAWRKSFALAYPWLMEE